MLALAFGGARGAPHGIVEPAKLALGSGIHVAHAAHHDVGLIIQIQAIGDQLLDIDFGRAFGTPVAIAERTPFSATFAPPVTTTFRTAAGAPAIPAAAIIAAIVGARAAASRTAILTSRPIAFLFCLLLRLLFFCFRHRNFHPSNFRTACLFALEAANFPWPGVPIRGLPSRRAAV